LPNLFDITKELIVVDVITVYFYGNVHWYSSKWKKKL